MSQIQLHGRTNNACLGFKPRDACLEPMHFQTNKCPDRQPDMVSLGDFDRPKNLDPVLYFTEYTNQIRRGVLILMLDRTLSVPLVLNRSPFGFENSMHAISTTFLMRMSS